MKIGVFTGLLVLLMSIACNKDKADDDDDEPSAECSMAAISASSNVMGYNLLDKVSGIWNGPVYSPTPLGSYPEWIVDFRPISSAQVSAKNELDSLNDIHMSFFVVKHDCAYKMAFRNGGGFAGNVRNSYLIIDSVSEQSSHSFYRFSDPQAGRDRVYADVTFKDDSLIMHVYTNNYNQYSSPQTHMRWTADLRDSSSCQNAINHFNFPQKALVQDFSSTFDGMDDAIFFSNNSDPYPEQDQPYLGNTDVNITVSNPATVDPNKKVLIIISTQPLFNGGVFDPSKLDYRSRYVFVNAASSNSFNFNYMHPGDYYVNAIYDENGDLNFSSGDYINASFDVPFSLSAEGNSSANVNINFQIP